MKAVYDLWDVETGNLIGSYDNEERALAMVRALVDANGQEYADVLELGFEDETGLTQQLGTGTALLARARVA
jgi:hypothetical protein